MHPVITAWLAMVTVLDRMPKWTDPAYGSWLQEAEALSDWFNTVRRLAL
jgi:hypothetical protein